MKQYLSQLYDFDDELEMAEPTPIALPKPMPFNGKPRMVGQVGPPQPFNDPRRTLPPVKPPFVDPPHGDPPPPTTEPPTTNNKRKREKPEEYVPPVRTYWNPNAASFGETDEIWRKLPDEWKAELSGFPMDGVRQYLELLKYAQDNNTRTGKNGVVMVDGKQMDTIEAAQYLVEKMRGVAGQMDANTRQYKEQQKYKAEQERQRQIALDKRDSKVPRVMPIFY